MDEETEAQKTQARQCVPEPGKTLDTGIITLPVAWIKPFFSLGPSLPATTMKGWSGWSLRAPSALENTERAAPLVPGTVLALGGHPMGTQSSQSK